MRRIFLILTLIIPVLVNAQCKVTQTDVARYMGSFLGSRINNDNTINVYLTSALYLQNQEFMLSVITETIKYKFIYPFACRELEIVFHDNTKIKLELDNCISLENGSYRCNFIINPKQLSILLKSNIKYFRIMDEQLLRETIVIRPENFRILREQLNCLINN
jgi:hypothetical protein